MGGATKLWVYLERAGWSLLEQGPLYQILEIGSDMSRSIWDSVISSICVLKPNSRTVKDLKFFCSEVTLKEDLLAGGLPRSKRNWGKNVDSGACLHAHERYLMSSWTSNTHACD